MKIQVVTTVLALAFSLFVYSWAVQLSCYFNYATGLPVPKLCGEQIEVEK